MDKKYQNITEWHDVDEEKFRTEIITQYKPAVLKGVVKRWPAVQHALHSPEAICKYLMDFDNGMLVNAVLTPPEVKGRMFYQDDMNGFNFLRSQLSISAVIHQLVRYSQFETSPSVAVQSAKIAECLPGFLEENKLGLLDDSILPRIWFGNEFIVAAHFDEMDNVACVVSGKRRFTLFPPDQVANLYIGPIDNTPAGAPISMVDLHNPDFERYPNFKKALEVAQVAELEAGDAIFIPALWWHHVQSLDIFNVLINYWWRAPLGMSELKNISPSKALLHCLLSMKNLEPKHREAWGKIFAHYAFNPDVDPAAHIPEHNRGILGKLSAEQELAVRASINPALDR